MKIFRYKITLSLVLMLAGSAATFAKMNVGANRLASVPNTGAKTAAALSCYTSSD
jgi:hypothetical protein